MKTAASFIVVISIVFSHAFAHIIYIQNYINVKNADDIEKAVSKDSPESLNALKDAICGSGNNWICWFNDWQARDHAAESKGWGYRCSFNNILGRCYCTAKDSKSISVC